MESHINITTKLNINVCVVSVPKKKKQSLIFLMVFYFVPKDDLALKVW